MESYVFYVAGPLFNAYEQAYQAQLAEALSGLGNLFLPQVEIPSTADGPEVFERCRRGVERSRIVVANLSGVDADSGTAFEVGYAYALGKPIYGVRSELQFCYPDRTPYPNLMLKEAVILLPDIGTLVARLRTDYPEGY